MEDPTRILSLMMDFGFDPRQVKILRMVMSEDMKEVKDFLRSPTGTGYEIAEGIAEYCLVSKDALKDILDGIRSSLNGDVGTEVIDDVEFGECRTSIDGIAKYSLDMTALLRVKKDISEFRIPNSVMEIGGYAFLWCESLEEAYIPDSVTEIGKCAFQNCTSLKEAHISDSVTEIGDIAFFGCESLKEVYIPDSVTEIGEHAFSGCTSAHFTVDAENEFYCSESGALFDKEKETLISGYALVQDGVCDIPDSVTEIGAYAFYRCRSLKEAHIPDSVTEIGAHAFWGCTSLKEVHIPNSVTEIGERAFDDCTSVHFIVDSNNKPR